jgi:hypothetical protein
MRKAFEVQGTAHYDEVWMRVVVEVMTNFRIQQSSSS